MVVFNSSIFSADDENDWLKKKKAGSKKEIVSSQIAQLGFASENVERIKKPKKVVKQLSSSVFFDGASIPSENAHGDKDDVRNLYMPDYASNCHACIISQ